MVYVFAIGQTADRAWKNVMVGAFASLETKDMAVDASRIWWFWCLRATIAINAIMCTLLLG